MCDYVVGCGGLAGQLVHAISSTCVDTKARLSPTTPTSCIDSVLTDCAMNCTFTSWRPVCLCLLPLLLQPCHIVTMHMRRFYAWDSLDTACFLEPAICSSMQEATVQVVVDGPSQGATILQQPKGGNTGGVAKKAGDLRAEGTTLSKPKRVVAAMDADASKFDAFLFKALTSASAGLPTAGGSCT